MNERPLRVLVAHPGAELYGSDRMAHESVVGLLDAGVEVTVLLPGDGPLAELVREAGARVQFSSQPVIRKSALAPRGLMHLAGETAKAAPDSFAAVRRSDVLYVSTLTVPHWLAVAKTLGVPSVVHVHEAEQGGRAARLALAPLRLADEIIWNSEFARRNAQEQAPHLTERGEVVPNGVAGPTSFTPARERIDGPARLTLVGRVGPRKGIHVAAAALRELRARGVDAELRVAGSVFPGYEWYEAELRRDFAPEISQGAFRLLGFRDDVWAELDASDVALVPSVLPEPFGNVAVEAGLAARPVVVSDCGGLPEAVAENAAARLVAPGDATALADAVQDVLATWPVVRDQAVTARDLLDTRHSPQRYRTRVAGVVTRVGGQFIPPRTARAHPSRSIRRSPTTPPQEVSA